MESDSFNNDLVLYSDSSEGGLCVPMTTDAIGVRYTYNPQVYTRQTLAKRPKCIWCGQRLPFDALDCPFCGGWQDD